jgi:NADP-dependent 3-hydroxy acid dehydrogenase YdfG
VVVVGSIAGIDTYERGSGYTSAKHAQHAVAETLRLETLGRPIRTTVVAPGLVETEFSLVRFDGDEVKAGRVYEGMTPLVAADVADAIAWAVPRPEHVNVDLLVIQPRDQAGVGKVHRRS